MYQISSIISKLYGCSLNGEFRKILTKYMLLSISIDFFDVRLIFVHFIDVMVSGIDFNRCSMDFIDFTHISVDWADFMDPGLAGWPEGLARINQLKVQVGALSR